MPATVHKSEIEVRNKLAEIGVSVGQMLDVVDAMVGARTSATPNDPPAAAAWSSWRMGTRRARDVTIDHKTPGWERDETDQISSVVNRRLGVRIIVTNTDDATGLDGLERLPQNQSRKGAATDRVVSLNQGTFLDILDAAPGISRLPLKPRASRPIVAWYLCVYASDDEVRAELSCPVDVVGGFFAEFVERVILIGPSGRGGIRRKIGDDDIGSEEFDVPVRRK